MPIVIFITGPHPDGKIINERIEIDTTAPNQVLHISPDSAYDIMNVISRVLFPVTTSGRHTETVPVLRDPNNHQHYYIGYNGGRYCVSCGDPAPMSDQWPSAPLYPRGY